MFNNEQLEDILILLNIKIIQRDGKYYALDNKTGSISKVQLNKDDNTFSFIREDINYNISFNNNVISISNDNQERVLITKNEISYHEKEDNGEYNKSYIFIDSSYLTFYNKINNEDINSSLSIKVYTDLDYMKKSCTINNGSIYKEDVIIVTEEDKPVAKYNKRKYSEAGSLITGTLYNEYLQVPISEYIRDELVNSELVNESLDKLDNMIPGLCNYCANNNSLLQTIIKEKQKTI